MAGMMFVDQVPLVKPHHGHHLLTFDSAGAKIELLLTRHALKALLNMPHDLSEGPIAEVVPFTPRHAHGPR
jgi:hypothetical protein